MGALKLGQGRAVPLTVLNVCGRRDSAAMTANPASVHAPPSLAGVTSAATGQSKELRDCCHSKGIEHAKDAAGADPRLAQERPSERAPRRRWADIGDI